MLEFSWTDCTAVWTLDGLNLQVDIVMVRVTDMWLWQSVSFTFNVQLIYILYHQLSTWHHLLDLSQNDRFCVIRIMNVWRENSLTLCTCSKWKFFFPFDRNVLWHTWHCCSVFLTRYTVSLDFALSTCVAICRHVWLTDRLLLPQTRHVQLRIWLLRRCSTNSVGDWTSSPQSLHSSPLLSASDSGTDPSASSAWETEHRSPSTQSVTSENLVVTSTSQWHTAQQLTSSHSRCVLLLWSMKIHHHHHHHKSPSVNPTEPAESA